MVQTVKRRKSKGMNHDIARKQPEYRYRFALLHHFKEFERAVWWMPGGRRVRFIT